MQIHTSSRHAPGNYGSPKKLTPIPKQEHDAWTTPTDMNTHIDVKKCIEFVKKIKEQLYQNLDKYTGTVMECERLVKTIDVLNTKRDEDIQQLRGTQFLFNMDTAITNASRTLVEKETERKKIRASIKKIKEMILTEILKLDEKKRNYEHYLTEKKCLSEDDFEKLKSHAISNDSLDQYKERQELFETETHLNTRNVKQTEWKPLLDNLPKSLPDETSFDNDQKDTALLVDVIELVKHQHKKNDALQKKAADLRRTIALKHVNDIQLNIKTLETALFELFEESSAAC